MAGSIDEPGEQRRADLVFGETLWVPLNGQRASIAALEDLDDAVFAIPTERSELARAPMA